MNLGKSLHKLGEAAFARPWRFISFWIVLLAVVGFAASQFMQPTSSSISIPGTEAQKAIDRVGELFPDNGGGTARVVFHAKDGTINDARRDIEQVVKNTSEVKGVSEVVSPFVDQSFVSDDGKVAYAIVQLDEQFGSIEKSTVSGIEKAVENGRTSSLQIEVGGDVSQSPPDEIVGIGEAIGVAIALVVLLMTLGSLIAAGMPIISALLAVGVSTAGLFSLSEVIDINSTTPVLGIMLGLAVGIDYSLFIISKYRSLVVQGYEYKEAAARAMGTAGNAVVFAAITVIIALSALSVVNVPFMTTMGLAGAASIAIAALVAISLIPALLGLAGPRVFSKKQLRRAGIAKASGVKKIKPIKYNSFWYKWGKAITTRPVTILIAAVLVVVAVAWPVHDLNLGLPSDQYAAKSSTERKAYDLLTQGFGAGFNGPLVVVVEGLPEVSDTERSVIRDAAMKEFEAQVAEQTKAQQAAFQREMAAATTVEQQIALQQKAAQMQVEAEAQKQAALAKIEENVEQYAKFVQLNKIGEELNKLDNVEQVMPGLVTDDGTAGILQVTPKTSPSDDKTVALIEQLRDQEYQQSLSDQPISLGVTGSLALQEDINTKLASALPVYLAVVVGLSVVLLIVAFRSILVPIKATLGFLLSVLAMFGAMVAVFQWGWFDLTDAPGPLVSFVPIIATGVLFGLAMDYEFFLVSGMHEAFQHSRNAKQAVVRGFAAGSKVVTAAAVIMISVFAGFMTNHEAVIQSIGFGLAFGILIDAFIVRMTITPAIMTLLGKKAWWLPNWLDKRLPHISIEGEAESK